MRNSFINKALELNQSGAAYATAMIVRRKIPSSGKPGDKAIITTDGQIHGWIGGGCTRGIVLKEALLSLQERKPRLVLISPSVNNPDNDNTKVYSMTCQSGGEVEVYIEPVLPKPRIVIFGNSHIAMAICKVAKALDYQVQVVMSAPDKEVFSQADHIHQLSVLDPSEIDQSSHVIVCTQGEGDADALFKALQIESPYIAFVASRKKANSIFSDLRKMGVDMNQLKNLKTPAGLDIGAKLPEEVAISILAEIIEQFRKEKAVKEDLSMPSPEIKLTNEDFYMNPVCNIPIQKSTARHILDYKGEKVYFCCDGCKVSFEKNPEKYMTA